MVSFSIAFNAENGFECYTGYHKTRVLGNVPGGGLANVIGGNVTIKTEVNSQKKLPRPVAALSGRMAGVPSCICKKGARNVPWCRYQWTKEAGLPPRFKGFNDNPQVACPVQRRA